jgi:pimeloyl-ACP methyl ester carboxylesterase
MPAVSRLVLVLSLVSLIALPAAVVSAQTDADTVTTQYVRLRPQTYGLLYGPRALGPESSVGLVVMHPNSDFTNHVACTELARRGFRLLCINGQYINTNRETMIWEKIPLDVKPAVAYLRQLPGIQSVVLIGHSGGGQLMPFYQNIAENGIAACQAPNRFSQCGADLAGLEPADGLILLDAHVGYSANTLSSLDPAVRDESTPNIVDPSLDIFSPDNGLISPPQYSPAFRQRYFKAQAERMLRLTDRALARRDAIAQGKGQYPDNEPFAVGHTNARLWQLDTSLVAHTRGSYPILHPDGSSSTEVAHSVRVVGVTKSSGGAGVLNGNANSTWDQGAIAYTVNSWLSSNALKVDPQTYTQTADDIQGIDWSSTNTSTPLNAEGVHVPLLMMSMTGHYWMVPDEIVFQHAASPDKTLVFVEGATHGISTCKDCEQFPGQYGDTVKTTFDYAAGWLENHFVSH